MDPQVPNGSGLGAEDLSGWLVYHFLQNGPNDTFSEELKELGHELPGPTGLRDQDWELQTDGNRGSHSHPDAWDTGSEAQEAAIQDIARQLVQIGDQINCTIPPTLVHQLVTQLRNLPEDGRKASLGEAVNQVLEACPPDMDAHKAKLVVTLLLAKEVASHSPSLLREVFRTAVAFINQSLLPYLQNLVRNRN